MVRQAIRYFFFAGETPARRQRSPPPTRSTLVTIYQGEPELLVSSKKPQPEPQGSMVCILQLWLAAGRRSQSLRVAWCSPCIQVSVKNAAWSPG